MTIKVRADRELCIGSENCTRYAPNSFETDLEGKVTVLPSSEDSDQSIRTAVQACPVGAISIVGD
jgi:ferredoxin